MDKLKIGDTYTHAVSFSKEDVIVFAKLTKDTNPIHLDEVYASKTIFKKTIVPGFLSGAVFSKVFGTLFPGIGTIYLSQEMKFFKPVYIALEYLACFEVLEVKEEKHRALVKCQLKEKNGEICIEGVANILHPEKI